MAIELHHLNTHGMMEQAGKVLDGVVRLKERIAELEKENAELKEQYRDMDVTHTVHIAKINALIEELEESQRWRKCSEEMPSEEGDYLVMARYPDDDEPHVEICFYDRDCEDFGHYERRYAGSGNSFGGFDGEEWVTHDVSFWMPLPSAPKEKKK